MRIDLVLVGLYTRYIGPIILLRIGRIFAVAFLFVCGFPLT